MGSNGKAIAAEFRSRFDWIWMYDLRTDVTKALDKLRLLSIVS
jgi:hypothetical protein